MGVLVKILDSAGMLFIYLKVSSKKVHQVTLLYTSSDAGYILVLATFLQKVPQNVIASHNLIVIWQNSFKIMPCRAWRRWNKYFQDFSYSIQSECLTVLVCNFLTVKLLLRRNNRIWCKGLVCKSSSVASNQLI